MVMQRFDMEKQVLRDHRKSDHGHASRLLRDDVQNDHEWLRETFMPSCLHYQVIDTYFL